MLLMNDKSEFTVRLYRDVLLETLLYGDRRRLTKLEQVGRLLHWIIESFHQRRPFLRISLTIDPLFVFICFYVLSVKH